MVFSAGERPGANPNTRQTGFDAGGNLHTREDFRSWDYADMNDCQFDFGDDYEHGYDGAEQGKYITQRYIAF